MVARRRDVTGSEAWNRLKREEASPTPQPQRLALALQLFVGLGVRVRAGEGLPRPRPPPAAVSAGSSRPCPVAGAGRRAGDSGTAARALDWWALFPGAARHVPDLGRQDSVAGDLSALRAMTAPGSGPARLPGRRGLRLLRFSPLLLLLLLLLAAVGPAHGWESGDLELFDLVEEVQLNFYQFLGVQQVSGVARPPEGCACGAEKRAGRAERRGWGGL